MNKVSNIINEIRITDPSIPLSEINEKLEEIVALLEKIANEPR